MGTYIVLEATLLRRNRLFVAMTFALILLAALSGLQGGRLAKSQASAIAGARVLEASTDEAALVRAMQIRSGKIDPPWWQNPLNVQSWSYTMVRHAALPPQDLAGVAVADADMQPFLFRVSPHPPDRWSNRSSELTPSVAAYGGFDLTEVLLMLTPLLVIVGFADVIRDRNGSERQNLSVVQAAGERRLLLMRLAPRTSIVILIVLMAAGAGIAAGFPPTTSTTLKGAAAIGLIVFAHTLFWILLASGLTLALRSAVSNFAWFVASWFVLGILAPVIVDSLARAFSPPPSPLAVFSAERSEVVRARALEEELTRDYAAKDPAAREMLLQALAENRLLITPTNLLVQREVDERREGARNTERIQTAMFVNSARWLSSFSPTLVARDAVYRQAGRDQDRRTSFDEQVAAYHAYLQEVFGELLMRRATLDAVLLPVSFEFEEGFVRD